jgi:hypothetical protein
MVESGSTKPFRSRRSELAWSSASSQVRERRPKRGTRMAVLGKGLPPETHGHKPPETASDPQISPSWDVGQRVLATASFDGEKRAPSCFSSIVPTPSVVPPSPYHHSFPPPPQTLPKWCISAPPALALSSTFTILTVRPLIHSYSSCPRPRPRSHVFSSRLRR